MKLDYKKPVLEEVGRLSDLTESNDAVFDTDVPYGTPGNPALPGGGIVGSR